MKIRILYATKHGSTEKAARMLSEKLGGAEIFNVRQAPAPEGCDCVILGGPVYMGRVPQELARYASKYLTQLEQVHIGLFLCGAFAAQAEKVFTESFPSELNEKADAKGYFGYEMDFQKLSFGERLITRIVGGKDTFALNEKAIASFAETFQKES